jgi:electron transport complex protein RnfC
MGFKEKTLAFPKGGVHPHDFKELTNSLPLKNAPIPSVSIIPMHQHMGKPAQCVVQAGDTVSEGMLIGKADGFFSANVHSPVPGKVAEIRPIYLPNGIRSLAVIIELEGSFERSGRTQEKRDWRGLSKEELLDRITEMGIVGLGGATFPTHVKYFVREGLSAEYFVVNGVECEPYLTGDHRLMLEKTAGVLEGARIVQNILRPKAVLIGIEENKADAIEAMERAVEAEKLDFRVVPLRVRYPQGDEKQLLKALIGREVPSGGLPIDIGAVVTNVGTVYAIYEALAFGKPLIERCVTVTGSVVKNPGNFKTRIGTKIENLIDECGGFTEMPGKIVVGGPMMGFSLLDLDSPVTKGVSGIIALSKNESRLGRENPCISCGRCIDACPFGLSPTRLYKLIDHLDYNGAMDEGLMDCKECGCCSYVCPSAIPLVQGLKLGKLVSRKKKVS